MVFFSLLVCTAGCILQLIVQLIAAITAGERFPAFILKYLLI